MCGGGGGGSDAVDYQREQERKRQKQIEQGKAQLDRIFAGLEGNSYVSSSPFQDVTREDFQEQLQTALNGNVTSTYVEPWNHSEGYIPGYTSYSLSDAGRRNLANLGLPADAIGSTDINDYLDYYDKVKASPSTYTLVEGTGTPIWEQQQQAYLDFANPQLEDQYSDAREDLAYALLRQGQGSGSLAGDRWGDLSRDYQLRQQDVAEQARDYGNQARSNVADQKQSLLTMLNSTADAGAAANAARSQVAALSATPSFSSLGPLFQNTTAGLAAGLQGNQQYQQGQRLNQIIYGGDPDQGSGRVVR